MATRVYSVGKTINIINVCKGQDLILAVFTILCYTPGLENSFGSICETSEIKQQKLQTSTFKTTAAIILESNQQHLHDMAQGENNKGIQIYKDVVTEGWITCCHAIM